MLAGFTPEWALVLEDPGITAVPDPYFTGRYLDGGKVTLTAVPLEGGFRLQTSGFRKRESDFRPQASGSRKRASDYRRFRKKVPAVLRALVTPCEARLFLFLQTPDFRLAKSPGALTGVNVSGCR